MRIFRRKTHPSVIELAPLTPPQGASYISRIRLTEALATPGVKAKLEALGLWWPNSRLGRSLARYFNRDGDLLAGGMALTILVSLTAAMTVALTIFMAVLGNYPALRTSFLDSINTTLPGLLHTPHGDGLVDPDDFIRTDIVNPTTVIGLLIAAWTGLGVVGKLGRSIRTMFGVVMLPEPYPRTVFRNLLGALALVISLVIGSGIGVVIDLAGTWLLDLMGLTDSPLSAWLLSFASYAIPFLIHMIVFWVLIRVVAGIRTPRRDMLWGLLILATGATLLRILGTGAVAAAKGPLLATAATLITLVLWINVQMRMTLMVSAWMANPPRAIPVNTPEEMRFHETPNYVTMSAPTTLTWPRHEFTGEVAPAPKPALLPTSFEAHMGPKKGRTLKSWLFGPRER